MKPHPFTVKDRFLRYVQIDTQSDPDSPTCPSTEKQKDLGRLLVQELWELGLHDAELDDHGYVYATLPGNSPKQVPVICFCAHMDTSPDCSGAHVKPLVHPRYDGTDIVLPDDPSQVIRQAEHPDLQDQIGHDLITASGTTLLGADNKAGLAEIMDAITYFVQHPEERHGPIRILFTPDEEIGRGADKVDLAKLGAEVGYTVDGERLGSMEDETFSANGLRVRIQGVGAHPGFAQGRMENALKIAGDILATLPKDRLSPETTSDREGFVHPVRAQGTAEQAELEFIVRDFETSRLAEHQQVVQQTVDRVMQRYPRSRAQLEVVEQYRNMKEVLVHRPEVVAYAREAIERAGLTPRVGHIRGGTDGSRLSFMGLPCPNMFAGEHAFHSRLEWVSVQDMQKAVETLVHLAMIWEERST